MDNNKKQLLDQIEQALGQVNFGSVEIIVQDKKVTQISIRSIQKTSIQLPTSQAETTEQKENPKNQNLFIPHQKDRAGFTIRANFRRRTD